MKPEVLISWTLEIDYSRAPCLGVDQNTRGLWERDCISARKLNERVRVQNVRDFLQTKLDSKINAPFLLNEHGDPHFLFHDFNEDNILNN